MDINDRGPTLNAGRFAMRVTNVGILGNAFFDVGLSFDPSFEFPRGSGSECLKSADLWVGALDDLGRGRVSGGPELEWRPTLDPADRVRVGWRGQSGSRRGVDDDGDGRVDEEIFNGRDDDGDGEIDEDLGFPSDQVAVADYTDYEPAAINYGYPNGEPHEPLGLAVHQEAYAWALPGFDAVAGVQFSITNRGGRTLRDVYIGMIADLDSRGRDDPIGHLDDLVVSRTVRRSFFEGAQVLTVGGVPASITSCFTNFNQTVPMVVDGVAGSGRPAAAVVGFGHTIDPLAQLAVPAANAAARAPARVSFRYSVFRRDLPPGQGGVPQLDQERYDALAGTFGVSHSTVPGDQVVLVSCGPFVTLAPGQSLDFAVALVAAPGADSLAGNVGSAAQLYLGSKYNLLPDTVSTDYDTGETGMNGHEVCLEPPPNLSFNYDPHCPDAVDPSGEIAVPPSSVLYSPGHCVWTNADCDVCTGVGGFETIVRWLDPGTVPPSPSYHVAPGDHRVHIAWDNRPEILLRAGVVGAGGYGFGGYHVYRLSDWRRESLLPPPEQWELIAAFGADTLDGQTPLSAVTDTTMDYSEIQYGQRYYPIGRYAMTDTRVQNGFDYLYLVTSVAERRVQLGSGARVERVESPLVAVIDSVVVPHQAASGRASEVWVVPNPYRGSAAWDRQPVRGDPFGRHIDFMGLPQAKCTIKIWTVAGDFVAQVDHDGRDGDGQASWNLISRNGQDVESGVYLFTVDSSLGRAVGRFVLIR